MRIAQLEAALEQKAPFTWLQMKPDSTVRFYTGFPTFEILVNTFNALQPTVENMYSWSQRQRLKGEGTDDIDILRSSLKQCKLSLLDQFYLVLQKLRAGTFNQVLADNLKTSLPMVSRIFISWINFLYFMLGSFCIWPTRREKIRQHAPACFRVHDPRCRGIIALFAHNILNGSTNISTIFHRSLTRASEIHTYNTRFASKLNFHRPKVNNNYGTSTFAFVSSQLWETIPTNIKRLPYSSFCNQYKLYLLTMQSSEQPVY